MRVHNADVAPRSASPAARWRLAKILVALDGSAASNAAARCAIAFARRRPGSEVAFLHVIDVPRMLDRVDHCLDEYSALLASARARARRLLGDHHALAREAGVLASGYARYGETADQIVVFAERFDADLIAIGNAQASTMRRLLNGSTRDALLRVTRRPLLLVPAGYRERPFRPRRAVVAGGDATQAARAAAFCADVAERDRDRPQLTLVPCALDGSRAGSLDLEQALRDNHPDVIVLAGEHRPRPFFVADPVRRVLQRASAPVVVLAP